MRLRVAIIAVLIAVLGDYATTPAGASDSRTDAHCVQQVPPTGVAPPAPHCFTTYAAAMSYLTGGRVTLALTADEPNGSGSTAVDQQIDDALVANGVTILSTEYKNAAFGGSTYTFTWGDTCADVNVAWSSMPTGWDNAISSSRPGSGCDAIHYDAAGAGPNSPPAGSSYACPSACSTMGTMNDRTSSMRWVHA